MHRLDEAVSAIGHGDDVSPAMTSIAEDTTQLVDLDTNIRFGHEGARPSTREKLVLAQNLSRGFDEQTEQIQGATANADRPVVLKQNSPRPYEFERAERQDLF